MLGEPPGSPRPLPQVRFADKALRAFPEGARFAGRDACVVASRAVTLHLGLQCSRVARPKRNWIQEERRKTLGDWVAFCLRCGHTLRYFVEDEAELPVGCPQCGGELRHRCPSCDAPIASAFAVECEECGEPVRSSELFGVQIRRPGK